MIRELAAATTAPEFHCGSLTNPIGAMAAEHDNVGDLLSRLRESTDDYRVPADGCASYQALYSGSPSSKLTPIFMSTRKTICCSPQPITAEEALATPAR